MVQYYSFITTRNQWQSLINDEYKLCHWFLKVPLKYSIAMQVIAVLYFWNKKLFWKVTSAPVFKLSRQKALEFQYLSKCAQYNSWWLIAISLKCLNMTFLRQKGWQLSRLGWLFASSLSSALLLVWSQSFHKLVRYINMQSNAYWHFGQCHFLADIIFVKNITRPQFWALNIYAKKA